ncbi:hypothetical protein RB653_002332 [Dictyostelium firmibasis]|uniref:BPL/LPL catalytic domain-containing protein n=1 Tax=Dictyostelium firmibasis TaxID=79012 RepID=A0AAN7TX21_9MYCE
MNFLNKNLLLIRNLGRISYPKFIDVQNGIKINSNINSDKNILLMAEHQSPLFLFSTNKKNHCKSTISSTNDDIINDAKYNKLKQLGYDVCKVTKSTENFEHMFQDNDKDVDNQIIWHGPGQLTVYPILSNQFNIDKNQYRMKLENVILKSLDQLSIHCKIENNQIKTLYNNEIIGDIKIFNDFFKEPGFSLNINPNIRMFNEINCLGNISSISRIINPQMITVADVVPIVSSNFLKEFAFEQIDPYNYYLSQYNYLLINKNNFNENDSYKIGNSYNSIENQLNSNFLIKNENNNNILPSSLIFNNQIINNSNNNIVTDKSSSLP